MERYGNHRRGVMSRQYTYVGEDTAEIQCADVYGVLKRGVYVDDIRQACEFKR